MNQELRDEIADMVKDGVGTVMLWALYAFWTLAGLAGIYTVYVIVSGGKF